MKGYIKNIEDVTEKNANYRNVLYTGMHLQLTVMSLGPKESLGSETHDVDQFFRIEEGELVLDGRTTAIEEGFGIIIPAGAEHNIVNTGEEAMKLYSLYGPPHHKEGTIHRSRKDAERDTGQFDGETTE